MNRTSNLLVFKTYFDDMLRYGTADIFDYGYGFFAGEKVYGFVFEYNDKFYDMGTGYEPVDGDEFNLHLETAVKLLRYMLFGEKGWENEKQISIHGSYE